MLALCSLPWGEQELTQKERMVSGQLYDATDEELVRMRHRARRLLRAHNATTEVRFILHFGTYFQN
jgi:hypothetical protein